MRHARLIVLYCMDVVTTRVFTKGILLAYCTLIFFVKYRYFFGDLEFFCAFFKHYLTGYVYADHSLFSGYIFLFHRLSCNGADLTDELQKNPFVVLFCIFYQNTGITNGHENLLKVGVLFM